MQQQNTGKDNMVSKLRNYAGDMFPVTSEEKEKEVVIPISYYTYKPITLTVVTNKVQTGVINDTPQYRYETASQTYYLPDEAYSSDTAVTVEAYQETAVEIPVYSGGEITGTTTESYYAANGQETLTPGTEIMKYLECTIHLIIR